MMRMMLGKNMYIALRDFMPLFDRMFERYDSTGEDVITWGAPLLFIFHAPKTTISGQADSMISCTYAMLAAHSMGMGTTMIGMVPPYIEQTKDVREKLGIPKENAVNISLIAGYPKMKFSRGILKPPEAKWIHVGGTAD
jgi:hypothetical protein